MKEDVDRLLDAAEADAQERAEEYHEGSDVYTPYPWTIGLWVGMLYFSWLFYGIAPKPWAYAFVIIAFLPVWELLRLTFWSIITRIAVWRGW